MDNLDKLGVFYLGREWDPERRAVTENLVLYDSKHLTTHAVCVGMTGSGKTGLCLALLEEAALDGIPAIAIDPKGDLGNLTLTFPELRPADFRPWIDPADAARAGIGADEHAAAVAERWRRGLADWGQDGARIARFRDAADVAIYTPGSGAGLGLQVLRSFSAPPPAVAGDEDALRERVQASVSGLLALVGLGEDPLQSREHTLLAILLDRAWRARRDVDLGTLIREIQAPPIDRVGVLDLESFYPARERFALATALNNLLAAPSFAAWLAGEPLDVPHLLFTPEGRPRISVLSIAHLSDAERMFFVTLLLNEVVAWVRSQPGTSSLRAILYMDEVTGFFPPTANPPAKPPMLTLLKQARAFGLGVVLATQNPVDLDYKALANAGTWLLGRLQTERDKARVLEGLEGASAAAGAAFDRVRLDATLAGLESRVFLMNDVHEDRPVLLHSRWALSYLRGPMTRQEIQTLMEPRKRGPAPLEHPAPAPTLPAGAARPVLPPGIEERFAPPAAGAAGGPIVYRPALFGRARLHFADAKAGIDDWTGLAVMAPLVEAKAADVWGDAQDLDASRANLEVEPRPGATFAPLPQEASLPRSYEAWRRGLAAHLARERRLKLLRAVDERVTSRPGETEGAFRARIAHLGREGRDAAKERLEKRYAPKLARIREAIRRAEERVGREESQLDHRQIDAAISVGATVLGALLGRKAVSAGSVGRATTAARGVGRAARERQDVAAARRELEGRRAELAALEADFAREIAGLSAPTDPAAIPLETVEVRPRRGDIEIVELGLVWVP